MLYYLFLCEADLWYEYADDCVLMISIKSFVFLIAIKTNLEKDVTKEVYEDYAGLENPFNPWI